MSYVEAGYSIGLGVLFLYAVALVLRRRRWERALRVIERGEPAGRIGTAQRPEHVEPAERIGPAQPVEVVEVVDYAEEQTAPRARS